MRAQKTELILCLYQNLVFYRSSFYEYILNTFSLIMNGILLIFLTFYVF